MANELYRAYDEMLQGFKAKNDTQLEHGVRCWMDLKPENPFPEDIPAYDLFFKIKRHYTVWRMGGADYKVNRTRMVKAAKDLCATYPKRPYKFDRKADSEDKAAKNAAEEEWLKAKQEAEELAIQQEAERIVKEEERLKKEAEEREKARIEWEKAEEEAKADAKRKEELLKKAVEKERAKIKTEEPLYVLGIVPETGVMQETVPIEEKSKESFFSRFFNKKFRKKAEQ